MAPSKGQIEAAIKAFEQASREHEMKGSQHPLDHEYIDAQFAAAKLRLRLLVGVASSTVDNVRRLQKLDDIVAEGGATGEEMEAFENDVDSRMMLLKREQTAAKRKP